MIKLATTTFILVLTIMTQGCSSKSSKPKDDENYSLHSLPPAFLDGGKAIDNLKTAFDCERIEFENWEPDDAKDSVLTICLINSKHVPYSDQAPSQMINIAREIKSELKFPEQYLSYRVLFVKQESLPGMVTRSQSNGMEVTAKEL